MLCKAWLLVGVALNPALPNGRQRRVIEMNREDLVVEAEHIMDAKALAILAG